MRWELFGPLPRKANGKTEGGNKGCLSGVIWFHRPEGNTRIWPQRKSSFLLFHDSFTLLDFYFVLLQAPQIRHIFTTLAFTRNFSLSSRCQETRPVVPSLPKQTKTKKVEY